MNSPKWSERCSEPIWLTTILYFVGHVKPSNWTLKREAGKYTLPGGSSASAVIRIPSEVGSDLPGGWSWASKHTCRLLALISGDESKRQVKETGLITEVVLAVTATVSSEGQLVKVDVLSDDVGKWAATRCLYKEYWFQHWSQQWSVCSQPWSQRLSWSFFETKGLNWPDGWPRLFGKGRGEWWGCKTNWRLWELHASWLPD